MKYSAILGLIFLLFAGNAQAIKKCKDADGKWHYGDYAEEKCATSKVTTLTDRGFVADTLEAPKTEEEKLVAQEIERKEKAELEALRLEQEERNRILSIYEAESDIDRQRDNKLASVDGNIRVHKAYLKQMDAKIARLDGKAAGAGGKLKQDLEAELAASKGRVAEFSEELQRLQQQRKEIEARFAREKELYHELTQAKK